MEPVQDTGFNAVKIERIEGRFGYLRTIWPTYLPGLGCERVVNSTKALAGIRILLIAQLRKTGG